MRVKAIGNRNANMGGWLTNAVNAAKKITSVYPGGGADGSVVNVQAAQQPAWVMPALFGALALGIFAVVRTKHR